MINNATIIELFSARLASNQSKSFRYKLQGKGKRVTGLLHTNNAEISVSFLNEIELEIDSLETLLTDSLELPPAKRIISWEQELKDCSLISGRVKNLAREEKPVSLYVIVEQ